MCYDFPCIETNYRGIVYNSSPPYHMGAGSRRQVVWGSQSTFYLLMPVSCHLCPQPAHQLPVLPPLSFLPLPPSLCSLSLSPSSLSSATSFCSPSSFSSPLYLFSKPEDSILILSWGIEHSFIPAPTAAVWAAGVMLSAPGCSIGRA